MQRRFWYNTILFVLIIGLVIVAGFMINNRMQIDVLQRLELSLEELRDDENLEEVTFARAETAVQEAEQAVEMAFNLLGLFEALSFIVTIVGGAAALFGFTRFISAQNELTETRKLVEQELQTYRTQFEEEIRDREAELLELREVLEDSAERERQQTSNALLANALIPLGERQYRASDYQGALNTYNRALELDPQNPVVNQRLAYVYTQSGNIDQAKFHYEKAIEREPDFAPALAGLGLVYRRIGEKLEKPDGLMDDETVKKQIERDKLLNRAEELLLQALEISPKLVDEDGESYWGILGGLYKRRGQIEQAIEAYRQATMVTPQSSYGFINLAQLYMKQQEREKMRDTFEYVERIASKEAAAEQGNFWGYADLIVSSYAIGKIQQANNALPIAISIAPVDSPYMLDALKETLRELLPVIEEAHIEDVQAAITRLENEIAQRAKQTSAAEADGGGSDEAVPVPTSDGGEIST